MRPKLFRSRTVLLHDLRKASTAILQSVPSLHTENLYFKFTVSSDPLLSTCQMYRRSTTCEAQTSANTRCRNSTVNGMTLNKTAECECATFLRIPACSPSGFTWGGAVAMPLALQHCQLTFYRMPQNIADYPKRSFQPRKPHGTLGHFAVP